MMWMKLANQETKREEKEENEGSVKMEMRLELKIRNEMIITMKKPLRHCVPISVFLWQQLKTILLQGTTRRKSTQ